CLADPDDAARQGDGRERPVSRATERRPLSETQDFGRGPARSVDVSGVPAALARELLAESLAAWRLAGGVERSDDGGIVVRTEQTLIRIDPEPAGSMFRWTVTIDGRRRPAVSLISVLRQVREAIDPGYAASRVRVTVAPLLPP